MYLNFDILFNFYKPKSVAAVTCTYHVYELLPMCIMTSLHTLFLAQ